MKHESLLRNSVSEKYDDLQELRDENDLLKRENLLLKKRIISLENMNEHSKLDKEDFKIEYALEPSDDAFINI